MLRVGLVAYDRMIGLNLDDLAILLAMTPRSPPRVSRPPTQAGKRWPVERTHSWLNGYGKRRRTTDKNKIVVEFYLYLTAALTVIRRLINRARSLYRWPTRPTTRRLH